VESFTKEELAFMERAIFAMGPFCDRHRANTILVHGNILRAKATRENRIFSEGGLQMACTMLVASIERKEGDLINIKHKFGDGPSLEEVCSGLLRKQNSEQFTSD
jgi:hypothetical protein